MKTKTKKVSEKDETSLNHQNKEEERKTPESIYQSYLDDGKEESEALRLTTIDLYYDPEFGLGGADKLYRKLKKHFPAVTLKFVKETLRAQSLNQQFKPARKVKRYVPIYSSVDGSYCADLIFYPSLKHHNRGYHIVLVVVEMTSRKMFAIPLKDKESREILRGFQSLFRQTKDMPMRKLSTDKGSEFISVSLRKVLIKRKISHYANQEGDHSANGLIERANRTLKKLISVYMASRRTKNWINALEKIVRNYNSTHHSSIGCTPIEAHNSEEIRLGLRKEWAKKKETVLKRFDDHKMAFRVGDRVRANIFEGRGCLEQEGSQSIESYRWRDKLYGRG